MNSKVLQDGTSGMESHAGCAVFCCFYMKIQMVVFDWAGTTVDYGSSAPAEVFSRIFKAEDIHLTIDIRIGPMGMEKKAHIRELLKGESGNSQWLKKYGRPWTEKDIDTLYHKFEKELYEVVAEYSVPIEGVPETVKKLRENGLKIGSTTGYTSQMMERVIPEASSRGYEADCVMTPDVTGTGRPAPYMVFACMQELGVYPPEAVVKVGDTVVDILEGKNAGAWSVGILTGSNLLGLTEEEYRNLSEDERKERKEKAARRYREAGADLVIDSFRDLPGAIEELNRRLEEDARRKGEAV